MADIQNADFPALFRAAAACNLCSADLDPSKALRLSVGSPGRANIFVIGQALAEGTQRVTGVPYFGPDGRLASTGKRLEKLLERVGATLHPMRDIDLPGGRIAAAAPDREQVFCSEIVHCFPGKFGKGDLFPKQCAERCLGAGFLDRELALADPRLILLLGTQAGRWFWRRYAGSQPPYHTLTEGIRHVVRTGRPYTATVAGLKRLVVPLIHPSGLALSFGPVVLANIPLLDVIRRHARSSYAATPPRESPEALK